MDINNLNCLIDLHLHLDGALSLSNIKNLMKLDGLDIPSDEELLNKIQVDKDCKDLNQFLTKFAFPCSLLQSKDSLTIAVKTLLKELKEEGLMYVEIRFAPQLHTQKGLTQKETIKAVLNGFKDSPIKVNLICCLMRGAPYEMNLETIYAAKEFLNQGVVALDLAGAEGLFPTIDYKELFLIAKKEGIPFTIHAGEASGPSSVKDALSFKATRIGHGVRSVEDSSLVDYLVKNKIPLEICPTSNIQTQAVKSYKDLPIQEFLNKGVIVTINTDDKVISNINLKYEYQKIIETFNFNNEDIKKILINGVNSAFLSNKEKEELIAKIAL